MVKIRYSYGLPSRPLEASGDPVDADAQPRVKIRTIVLGGFTLIVVIAAFTGFMINTFRERALDSAEQHLENTVKLLSRHFDQLFEDLVEDQAQVVEHLRIADMKSPAEFSERLAGPDIQLRLREEVRDPFGLTDIFVFDATGEMINTSRVSGSSQLNVSKRDFFRALRFNATAATTLAVPVRSFSDGPWTTILARRLLNSDGVFLGVLTKRIDSSQFERFFGAIELGRNSTVSMVHRGGELIASFPRLEVIEPGFVGPPTLAQQVSQQITSGQVLGGSRMPAMADGNSRLIKRQQLGAFPMLVTATIETSVALQEWRAQTRLLIIAAALFVSVIVAVFLLIGSRLSQERKSTEQRLALGKQRIDTALTNMSQGLCLFDSSQNLVISNPRFSEIYRLDDWQVAIGMPFDRLLEHMFAGGATLDHEFDVNADPRSVRRDHRCRLRDGRVISIQRINTPDGGWVSTHEDISDRERAASLLAKQLAEVVQTRNRLESQQSELIATAEALSLARDEAEAASRSKSDFLAMMSHEIRTPMAGMMGMIELLCDTSLDVEQKNLTSVAQEAAHNLLTVVNNILDFSKLEAGQLTPEVIDFNIKNSLNSIVMLLGPKARDKGLLFETSISDDLPPWLRGDPSRLGQILLNLVGNAIKFTQLGSIHISVSHILRDLDRIELRVAVTDTGKGIPDDVQSTLFNPFTQADTSVSRKYGGTGLGLAICKQLCRSMGGEIGVDSEVGRGSTFSFTLLCQIGLAPELNAAPLQPTIDPEAVQLRILVAEDNEMLRGLMSKLLARRGYKADLVSDGSEVVAAVQNRHYDLILMDMQMPIMDGISATAAVRRLDRPERDVPIIALTANALVGQREICLAAGMNGFLTKPIQPEALYAAILQWARRRR
ncbi:ATP-binding protein [Tardiphaga sp.]|uniref:ATP-binding protein n=1 Tax=Tardiphaga sp. TaxID=1926292 RepID=UPI0025D061EF|nr:ATP-binding protein [Tardiphaga sp.]